MPPKRGSKKHQKAERERKRQEREKESEESELKRLDKQKTYDTERRMQMTPEEKTHDRKQDTLRKASQKDKMAPEEQAELAQQKRLSESTRRESMSPEKKADDRKRDRLRKASVREEMSSDDKTNYHEQDRIRKASAREKMSPEKRAELKEQARLHKASVREEMGSEERAENKEHDRLRKTSQREKMTPKDQSLERKKNRESHAVKRKFDKMKVITIQEAAENFKMKCHELPEYVCTCCHRLLWKQSVLPFNIEKYDKDSYVIKKCFASDIIKETRPGEIYICTICIGDLKKRKPVMPAVANGLWLDPTPPAGLQTPNQMEVMMFRREIPFMKVGNLPRGRQYHMQGPVVNVPSKLDTICQLLPRLPNDAMLVPIKLKFRLCYKGHYLYESIRPHVVMEWLKWLKENNPHYSEVNICFDWCNLMAQYQDDGKYTNPLP